MAWAAAAVLLAALLSSQPVGAAGERGDLTPNQLTAGRTLTRDEALAACGPAAVVALARARGRAVTLDEAVAVARGVGWTAEVGMAGPQSELALLARLGVPARLEAGVDRTKIAREVQAGRPVIVRLVGGRGHYMVAERYDPASGRFDFGQSALVVKASGGRRWFGVDELGSLGVGRPTETIYLAEAASAPPGPPAGAAGPSTATPRVRVAGTDGQGLNLRAEPSTAATRIKAVREGAVLEAVGPTRSAAGQSWRKVRDPADGASGWVAAEYLVPAH